MNLLKRHAPSPAMIVALVALFVALGGAAYAGVTLSNNSVRSGTIVNGQVKTVDLANSAVANAKLKNNSVNSAKIKNNTVASGDIQDGTITGADVADNSLTGADLGNASVPTSKLTGALPATVFPTQLPSGLTLRGTFAGRAFAGAAGQNMQIPITFQFPLSSAPVPHFIVFGGAAPPECTGTSVAPTAAPGHLCVYESAPAINANGQRVFNPITAGGADNEASTIGAAVAANAIANADFRVRGSWAVTAP
jgi:hypothetical protein